MLSLRNRFGIPGVISVIALVFALVAGTAFAAENSGDGASASAKKNNRAKKNRKGKQGGLNGKQKRQVIALAKRFASAGPQGPQGFPGLPGAPGDDGDDGSDGSDGDDGASVDATAVGPGVDCPTGGTTFAVGGAPAGKACNGLPGTNGEDGDPWTAGGVLPDGATETGSWTANAGTTSQVKLASLSFPVPLPEALPGDNVHFESDANFSDFDEAGPETEGCIGTEASPTAPDGHLCVYVSTLNLLTYEGIGDPSIVAGNPPAGAGTTGAVIQYKASTVSNLGNGWGTWAVTGFTPTP